MIRPLFSLLAVALVGCASIAPAGVAVCDGKHRRPANPYGSVLPDAPLEVAIGAVTTLPPKPAEPPATPMGSPTTRPQTVTSPTQPANPGSVFDRKSTLPCGRPQ